MMRMWAVHPKVMCKKHLMEEHNNLHKFVNMIKRDSDLTKYKVNNYLDPKAIPHRHGLLTKEMERRGISHVSPISARDIYTKYMNWNLVRIKLDSYRDVNELYDKCFQCRRRMDK